MTRPLSLSAVLREAGGRIYPMQIGRRQWTVVRYGVTVGDGLSRGVASHRAALARVERAATLWLEGRRQPWSVDKEALRYAVDHVAYFLDGTGSFRADVPTLRAVLRRYDETLEI